MYAILLFAIIYLFFALVKKAWFPPKQNHYKKQINKTAKSNSEEPDEFWVMKLSGVFDDKHNKK